MLRLTRTLFLLFTSFVFVFNISVKSQSIYEPVDLSKVKFSLDEMGKMWTFDDVPVEKFEQEYGFKPTREWLDDVRMSALQFSSFCSAAFVSADGLIMTNHHCGRGYLPSISPKGKDYLWDGFYAEKLEDEIKIPGLYVDQLKLIRDVTSEVLKAMNSGNTDEEKIENRNKKIKELTAEYNKETGLTCSVVQLYNGGKFSLYGYKRYTDIRLVMAPDFQIACTGWDWDNFTYPRYELDFMFFRAYDENGKPIKNDHYFKWSKEGAEEGEPIFVIGRPGSTQRINSVSELEFLRDKTYKYVLLRFNELYKVYYELFMKHPERHSELLNSVMSVGNARKSYAGSYMALCDDYIMAKKKDFEKTLRNKVDANPELKEKYGYVWTAIKNNIDEYRNYVDEYIAYSIQRYGGPEYISIAQSLIDYAEQMKLPEDQRNEMYKGDKLQETLAGIFPKDVDEELQQNLVRAQINYMVGILGEDDSVLKSYCSGKTGDEAAADVIARSNITTKEKFDEFIKKPPDEILNSDDPFISFIMHTRDTVSELKDKITEVSTSLQVLNQLLGEVTFAVYGDQIPPDATSTLRISDGRIQGYEYNGTIAPGKTTFFGLWDRWYSFGKKEYPWGLHPRWQKIPEGFDLSTPVGFASTNDIVGGNSGSSAINEKKEVIGVIHDGNMESLAGDFIFLEQNNRAVGSDSKGLLQALKYIYKTDRLVNELETGKLSE